MYGLIFVAGLVSAVTTGVGTIPLFWADDVSDRFNVGLWGLAGGLMASASVFGLGYEMYLHDADPVVGLAGLLSGAVLVVVAHRIIDRIDIDYDATDIAKGDMQTILSVLLILMVHSFPEGLAIGVAFASGLEEVALVLAVVIGLQNVPDGFAFAVPMAETGMSNLRVIWYTTLSGVVPQVVASVFGFLLVGLAAGLFPVASGFAAGAMLAVVFRELIPSSHGHGHADAATGAFLVGFVLLVVVDAVVVV